MLLVQTPAVIHLLLSFAEQVIWTTTRHMKNIQKKRKTSNLIVFNPNVKEYI